MIWRPMLDQTPGRLNPNRALVIVSMIGRKGPMTF
jgi:hypothetical protein